MLKQWKFWIVMAGILGVVGLLAFGFTKNPRIVKSPLVGRPVPSFAVTELNTGQPLSSADLKGKPYLINFWASWCVACRAEAPLLQAAHTQYEKKLRALRVVGIAIQDTLEDARKFAKQFGKTYYLAMDNEAGDISLNFGIYGVPETFFVNADGNILYKHIGELPPEVLKSQIEKLLSFNGNQ